MSTFGTSVALVAALAVGFSLECRSGCHGHRGRKRCALIAQCVIADGLASRGNTSILSHLASSTRAWSNAPPGTRYFPLRPAHVWGVFDVLVGSIGEAFGQ